MRRMTIDELKQTQLDILCFVADFCEENKIQYWIDSGTLLGAVRHQGYIPWDDDIDVGMLREDYDRFSELFNQKQERYILADYTHDKHFYLPHGKVCDPSTVLFEPDINGNRLSVNIDIFVYDNAPDDDCELKRMYDRRDRLRRIYAVQNQNIRVGKNPVKKLLKMARRTVYRIVFPRDCIKKMIENSKKYATTDTKRVGNFTAYTRMSCDKKVFSDFIDLMFEGKQFKAPIGYDEWLKSFYGNYMELPPIEKRVSHHSFEAYVGEENAIL